MIPRQDLRTAITAGLSNGFASISGVEFGQYVALAVLAVSTGSYGGSLELGRQRLLGTALGSLLLLVGYEGLRGVPLPLAIAITLGSLRLLGGLLGLQVGYKVGGIVIVMGWITHHGDLATWIPLRFFWTSFGVIMALLSLRLFWPAQGLTTTLALHADLLQQLQGSYRDLAARLDPAAASGSSAPVDVRRYRALRDRLIVIRGLRPALLRELGTSPERHPAAQLLVGFDASASRLITVLNGLRRQAPSGTDPRLAERLHRAEAELLEAMAAQLGLWERQLRTRAGLPEPPARALQLPHSWEQIVVELSDPGVNAASLDRLSRIASRLLLCRHAEQTIRDGETRWHQALRSS